MAHHLTIEHLFGILLHTGDMRFLAALVSEFGFELVAKTKPKPEALTKSLINIAKEVSNKETITSEVEELKREILKPSGLTK